MQEAMNFFISNTFFNLNFFYGFVFEALNILSFDQKKNMNMLYMKKCQSLNKMTKKLLDGYSSTLEVFLLKHICIFVLVNRYYI